MLALWAFDLVAAVVLGITALIGAYLPVILVRRGREAGTRSLGFVLGNMLAAGVMVAAGFVGLLGEAGLELAAVSTYPLGAFLAALGFLATLVADQAAESYSGGHGHTHGASLPFLPGGLGPKDRTSDEGDTPRKQPAAGGGSDVELGAVDRTSGAVRGRRQGLPPGGLRGDAAAAGDVALVDRQVAPSDDEVWRFPAAGYPSQGAWEARSVLHEAMRDAADGTWPARQEVSAAAAGIGGGIGGGSSPGVSILSAVLMTVALSFHSLLEGAALGAAQDAGRSMQIFVAILAHKGLTAFALGSSLVQAGAAAGRFWAMVLLMAGATPVGIAIGFLLSGLTNNTGAACISALAAGTFIYVAIVEILPRELAEKEFKAMKLVMLGMGFGLMSLLAVWA